MNTNTFEVLQIKVISWAKERDLLNPENAKSQFLKVIEETGELAGAIAKDKKREEVDAFGDVLVTLIILAQQRQIHLTTALEIAYNEIKERKGKTINGNFIKE